MQGCDHQLAASERSMPTMGHCGLWLAPVHQIESVRDVQVGNFALERAAWQRREGMGEP